MATNTSESSDYQNELYQLIDDLSQLVMREHQVLQEELSQVRSVIGDAVITLDEIFRRLQKNSREQMSVVDVIREISSHDDKNMELLTGLSEKIYSDTVANVRALQFDDIIQQLTLHSCNRIERMQQLFQELDLYRSRLEEMALLDGDQGVSRLKAMQEKVSRFRELLEKENPVKQTSMQAGKVELF